MPGKQRLLVGVSPLLLHPLFCPHNQHRGILREVDPTAVAFAAVVLNVTAGGTSKAERGVAARAELRLLGILMKAFGALHF